MNCTLWLTPPLSVLSTMIWKWSCSWIACNAAMTRGVGGWCVQHEEHWPRISFDWSHPISFFCYPPPSPTTHAHSHTSPPCPGHLSDSARELGVPAGVRATERPCIPGGCTVGSQSGRGRVHTHTHTRYRGLNIKISTLFGSGQALSSERFSGHCEQPETEEDLN